MSVNFEFYKLASRNYLHQMFYSSFNSFDDCFKRCWCCIRQKLIKKEFEKKGIETFNSTVDCWKIINTVNCFVIEPLTDEKSEAFVSSDQEKATSD